MIDQLMLEAEKIARSITKDSEVDSARELTTERVYLSLVQLIDFVSTDKFYMIEYGMRTHIWYALHDHREGAVDTIAIDLAIEHCIFLLSTDRAKFMALRNEMRERNGKPTEVKVTNTKK
jgi:hypothetical protein